MRLIRRRPAPAGLRRPTLCLYRCSLPGLTGFVASRREDANASRHNLSGCWRRVQIWRRGRDCSRLRRSSLAQRSGPPSLRSGVPRRRCAAAGRTPGFEPLLNSLTTSFTKSIAALPSPFMAEREGFEPSNTFWDVTHFPGERLRPLGHLSTAARKGTGGGAIDQIGQPAAQWSNSSL